MAASSVRWLLPLAVAPSTFEDDRADGQDVSLVHPGTSPLTPPSESASPEALTSRGSATDPLRPLESPLHGRPCQGAEIAIPSRCLDDPFSPLPLTGLGLKYQIGRNEETAISSLQFPEFPESSLKNAKLGS